jgi:succinate dehydrogenase flavin-adding protein (antitoxin of CptAB toxin-antitoxin module)
LGYKASRAKQKASRHGSSTPSKSGSISRSGGGGTTGALTTPTSFHQRNLHPNTIKAQQKLSDTYGIKTYTQTGRISTTPKTSSQTWTPITSNLSVKTFTEKTKAEIERQKKISTVATQQKLSDTYGITTYDKSGNISTTPKTPESTWKTHNVRGDPIVVTNRAVGKPNETLREQVEAKNKATLEFREKWHGIRENGVLVTPPTATKTDAVQALLNSTNLHIGTDTRNLETYLTERDYDISSIIAGETTIPDDIFKPVKQTEVRNTLKETDENTIREIVDNTSTTPQNVSRSERGVPEEEKTITQVRSFNLLPIIFIAVVGLIGIYLIRRKK